MNRITSTGMLATFCGCMLTLSAANAHFYAEAPSCRAPTMPLQFVTELDRQEFDRKVDEYRDCLEDFVNRQNEAISTHQSSADKTAAIWKDYVERVLEKKLKPAEGQQAPGATPQSETAPAS